MAELKLKMAIARFPYGGTGGAQSEAPAIGDWLYDTALWGIEESRVELLRPRDWRISDTPITMTRNRMCKRALDQGVDILVMCDSDQIPDIYFGIDKQAKQFIPSGFEFMYEHWHKGPCLIVGPYCGPEPGPVDNGRSCVYVFKWAGHGNTVESMNRVSLDMYSREEACLYRGFSEVAAGPTGMIMIDTRVFKVLRPPWFEYEWKDEFAAEKASTEDVFFTRNCSLAGMPVYCNWDSWAGHVKPHVVGRPTIWTTDDIRTKYKDAIAKGYTRDMEIRDINVGKSMEEINKHLPPAFAERIEPAPRFNAVPDPDYDVKTEPAILYNAGEETAKSVIYLEETEGNGEPRFGWVDRKYGPDLAMRIIPVESKNGEEGWGFNTSDDDLDTIYELFHALASKVIEQDRAPEVAEIGSWVGQSTRAIAQALFQGAEGGFITAIDTWLGGENNHLGKYIAMYGGSEKIFGRFLETTMPYVAERNVLVTPIRMDSKRFADECTRTYDGVFIDGDHSEDAVSKDIISFMRLIRPGGLIAGHDYDEELFPDVIRVVSELLPEHNHQGRVWWHWVEGGAVEPHAIPEEATA